MKESKKYHYYTWLVTTLLNSKGLTLEELNRRWMNEEVADGNPLARTTFNRYRDGVLEMFGLIIDCDREHRYFIANPSEIDDDSMERWMLSTLTVGGVLADSASLKDRIMLESVPAGEEFLPTLIRAIKTNRYIMMGYQKFGSEGYVKQVAPLALKLSKRRWYLLADTGQDKRTYSLDRIKSVELTKDTFKFPDNFSPQQYYGEYFGVLTDGTPLCKVVVRAYGRMADYLRTLPVHPSQKETLTTADYADFTMQIRPTADFVSELISRGDGIEVLEPAELRDRMAKTISAILKRYE